ncbi:hypothetical protein [Leptolyngbya sp. CCY15150]|nr:hypothetical protein [Leptolyngbya sp. CCY15150]
MDSLENIICLERDMATEKQGFGVWAMLIVEASGGDRSSMQN